MYLPFPYVNKIGLIRNVMIFFRHNKGFQGILLLYLIVSEQNPECPLRSFSRS